MTNPSKCRACGAVIVWEQTASGKWTPKNEDGKPHWSTCPKADEFKRNNRAPDGLRRYSAMLAELTTLRAEAARIKARIFAIQAEVNRMAAGEVAA